MLQKAVNSIAFAFQREELLTSDLLSGFISVWPKMKDFGTATAQQKTLYKTRVLKKRCWTVLIEFIGEVRERRTVFMPLGCRRSLSQNTYKEKDCIVSIPFHPSSDSQNKRFTLKSSVSLLGSLVRQRGFPSNYNYVDRWDNIHKIRHLQNPQRTLLCG